MVKTKTKKCLYVGTIPISNKRIVERCKIDTPSTQIFGRSCTWLGIGASIKNGGLNNFMGPNLLR
jgi:hypothetical protein